MAGRVGVDFGTSNTVVAVWDDATGDARTLWIPDYGHLFRQGSDVVPVVPSLVHYAADGRQLIGDQVLSGGLYDAQGTFRWMKRYVAHRSPIRVGVGGRHISHADAGQDFLAAVLTFAAVEAGAEGDEVALTVPVESFEDYADWLGRAAESAGMSRYRLLDEPSAAALGYGAHIQPGQVYLLFDFGGGTVQAAVVRVLDEDERLATGRPCRVLGKAGDDIGGSTIDHWIFAELLARNGCRDSDDDVRDISRALLVECERGKQTLTDHDRADVSVMHPRTGRVLEVELVRAGRDGGLTVSFEELLDRHELFSSVDRVMRRALRAAQDRGFDDDDVTAVLMVGGSSLIPAVQRAVQRVFGRERVLVDRPLDAVARGAAAVAAGVDFYDHIQHDYAVRWFDRSSGRYEYRTCVAVGTPYPTEQPVATMTVNASHDGQRELGIAIYELAAQRRDRGGGTELVLDPSGAWRVSAVTSQDDEDRSRFWLNEHNPTFLVADPVAVAGQPRFRVEFGIDASKRLLLTAYDLVNGRLTHRDHPVARLT